MISHLDKFIYVNISKTGSSSVSNILHATNSKKPNHHHILDLLNVDIKKYFKFATIRNPYDRIVSRYLFAKTRARIHAHQFRNLLFKDFVLGGHKRTPMNTAWVPKTAPHLKKVLDRSGFFDNQIEWLQDNDGNILVDNYIRMENIQHDFDIVCDKLNLPKKQLPHWNKIHDRKHYTEYYDDESQQAVAKLFERDIKYFGYKF